MAKNGMRFIVRYWYVVLAAVLLLAAGTVLIIFLNKRQQANNPQPVPLNTSQSNTTSSGQTGGPPAMQGETVPLSIRLSEGKPQPQEVTPMPVTPGDPLSPEEAGQLLARVPQIPTETGDQSDFRLAVQPIPPPRPGETVKEAFPPAGGAAQPDQPASGPLEVLRYSPEGEIPVAPFVSVTFNQPMVALATVEELAAQQVPVVITPPLEGTWRWMGTRTVTFEYDSELIDRLPKATEYRVTVPAGTKSTTGGVLATSVEWTFTTPPPKVTRMIPQNEPQPRDPLFFIHFDQRIDPSAVLKTIQVSAGSKKVDVVLVDEAAIKENAKWSKYLLNAQPGRWLAFKATDLLPEDTDISVSIGPGTPSAEGPLLTTETQAYSFRTYAPLRINKHGCAWGNKQPCQPLSPFSIEFNNPIDANVYTDDMLAIQPELPGVSVDIYGQYMQIQGASKGQTTYTVTVKGSIQDVFGQTLGKDVQLAFRVGSANPVLYRSGEAFVTLDPASKKPVFSVYAMNYPRLDVKIYAVQPSDWAAYKQYLRDFQRTDVNVKIPGRKVFDQSQPVEAAADELTEVGIDLSPYMDGPSGQFIVIVTPPLNLLKPNQNAYRQTAQAWVQVTQIGLDAFTDHSEMVVWATALKDGAPLKGVTIEAGPIGEQFTTGDDGAVRIPIPNGAAYLVARQGADVAMLPRSNYPWGDETWMSRPPLDELRWYVFDDRAMYRPGEEVHIKGWMRRIGGGQKGDVGLVGMDVSAVDYQIYDSQGNSIGSGQAKVNALGGFDLVYTIPAEVNLGYTQVQFTAGGVSSILDYQRQYNHAFQIQEFRRPEFEVTARNETTGPYFTGGSAVVAVAANYYAGGPLPNADVTWNVTSSPGHYAPPNWPGFTFGDWIPWWRGYIYKGEAPGFESNTTAETFTGKTDAAGEHYLQLDFDSGGGPHPVSIVADSTVMDVNRQAWTGTTTLLVHPASLYVGLRGEKIFVDKGTPLRVEVIVTDLDGKPIGDRKVTVRAVRLDWKIRGGSWNEEEVDPQLCEVGSTSEPVSCEFQTPIGGTYRITAQVTDDQGRLNQSSLTRWVSGGKRPPAREVEQEEVTLIPDKETYQPGDVARILVQPPFSPAEGLLTTTRSGIVGTQRFTITDGTITLEIPIEKSYIPNLNIQVDVNGSAPRTDDEGNPIAGAPARPAYATGQLNLSIPPVQRTLSLEVTPAQTELEPGGETTLDVVVKNAAGAPVPGAELAVVVVDESILALTSYQLADPIATFYTDRPSDLMSIYARATILLADPEGLAQGAREEMDSQNLAKEAGAMAPMELPAAAPMATRAVAQSETVADSFTGNTQQQPIRVRSDFNPLATFAPEVRTDANGAARITVKVPDNLTRYRVMVVAVDEGKQFGTAENNITARLPLMVRPSAPRFLNFGDRFELPVTLQNQTGEEMTVDVAVRTSNLALTGASGLRVTIPARDRVEVRFPAAAEMAGTARVQVVAAAGNYADAANIELPVYTPATTEAFATYGVIDEGALAQPVSAPKDVFPQFGGLEITTSSTALQALTDAVLYLVSYPYDCSEQIASRVMAIAALRDVLTAFDAEGLPSASEMEASVARDIKMLQTLQNSDGGFPYWRRGDESIPFNTIHAANAMYRAKSKGFSVPEDVQQRALDYLRNIENYYPSYYSQPTRRTLSAYALNVRHLMGDSDPQKALKLLEDAGLENLSLDVIGWLWPVLQDAPGASDRVEAIRRYVNNRAVETAGAANFTTDYDDQNYLLLGSNRRTDAILMDALIGDNPQHDLIPKLVNGLLGHRTRGRWGNTQENVFVLLALDKYFNAFEAQTPDFVAQIWLGDTYAGSHEFRGRTTERSETTVPMNYLVDVGGTQDLILNKDGAGRLYYRLGLRYAPTDLQQDPLEMGFVVRRMYEAVDNPEDVRQDADGVWHIKAGARVRVKITMVADNRRYHVALVDPLPAGLEIVNPSLAVSGSLPADPAAPESRRFWWWGPWYQHQNMRDERAEAFTPLLWDGVYQYSYVARATTPGQFVVPPAKAEEMYSPEVFGRSGSDMVIVE